MNGNSQIGRVQTTASTEDTKNQAENMSLTPIEPENQKPGGNVVFCCGRDDKKPA